MRTCSVASNPEPVTATWAVGGPTAGWSWMLVPSRIAAPAGVMSDPIRAIESRARLGNRGRRVSLVNTVALYSAALLTSGIVLPARDHDVSIYFARSVKQTS